MQPPPPPTHTHSLSLSLLILILVRSDITVTTDWALRTHFLPYFLFFCFSPKWGIVYSEIKIISVLYL